MVSSTSSYPIQRIIHSLFVHDGGYVLQSDGTDSPGNFHPRMRRFDFELCRKQFQYGDVPVDQFWMNHGTLYGQRGSAARNQQSIVDYFWLMCRQAGTAGDREVKNSYMLLNLLPRARSNGSRRVFEDAKLSRSPLGQGSRHKVLANLNERLSTSASEEIELPAFRAHTAALLGPPEYSAEVHRRYYEMEQELFGDGPSVFDNGNEAIGKMLERWHDWMRSLGRRSGNTMEKQILDVFSYECRAALHRAYSAVWTQLLPTLAAYFQLSAESERFHRLWHLEQCDDPGFDRRRFHLFHGHIFGLHPGLGIFAQTRKGGELIGAALREPGIGPAFQRLLAGVLVALHDYVDRGESQALLRTSHRHSDQLGNSEDADLDDWERDRRNED